MKRFKSKRVVITGAGSGLGRRLALDFSRLGWNVLISDINPVRMKESALLAAQAGGRVITSQCDVSKYEEVAGLAEFAERRWGGVDIVINNAGVPAAGYLEKVPIEDWKWIIDINLLGPVYGCKAFIPLLKKSGGGHIVNIASAAGIVSLGEMAPYNATKAAVISLSETLKSELASSEIGVTVACPSFFKTNLMDQMRTTDQRQEEMAKAFFANSLLTVEAISRSIIKGIGKNRLYVVPQLDAKVSWLFKRLAPETYYRCQGFIQKRSILEYLLRFGKGAKKSKAALSPE